MVKKRKLIIVRGGGDIATGTIQVLNRTGFSVLVLEAEYPSAIRRQVALSEAVYDGRTTVEDTTCVYCQNYEQAQNVMAAHDVALLVDSSGQAVGDLKPWAVVDAILAKYNVGTTKNMAPVTVALGPGFTAGVDVDYVIETMRGHNLGRIISHGKAQPNTGVPGIIGGYGKERVIHSEGNGFLYGLVKIGDIVTKNQAIAKIITKPTAASIASQDGILVRASLNGLLRGLIRDGYPVTTGFKIADIDPRESEYANCFTVSDKARCIGGSVLTVLMQCLTRES